ncbi:MAG: glycosyltransferase [Flavobacteriaceae bacterium]|nr:glycosyltransferase [Flavobacteriaceae bacterium]
MKAILFSLGSRGDIEPFLALGEILKEKKWEIVYVFPEQFRDLVGNDDFYSFTKEFIEVLLASKQSKVITSRSGSIFKRLKTLFALAIKSIKINKEVTLVQKTIIDKEQPDYIFYNHKCVYPILWEFINPNKGILVLPFPCLLHKVDNHSIIGFGGGGNYGKFLNRLSYSFPNVVLSLVTYFTTKKYHKELIGKTINPLQIRERLLNKAKSFYTISPTLFPQPINWKNNANVVGYFERNKIKNWETDKSLDQFIKKYDKIVFITFGSISNTNPAQKTNTIVNALSKHKIPAIINTAWGGLIKPEKYPEHIYFVNTIPYDWIFPKMYAVIHHGGSGTTHLALKYGCASLIIPHFIDQFFWNTIIHKLKVGTMGTSIKKLNKDNFETLLLDLLSNKNYKKNAELIAGKMQKENNTERLLKLILE